MQNVIRFPDRDFLIKCEISTIWRRFHWFLHFLSAESSPYFYFRFILPTASTLKLIWPPTAELLLSCCWYFAWPCDLDFWPFDLDQLSYTAGHLINTAKQVEDPMPIRSWVMSYNVFQWKCVLDYCACAVSRDLCFGGKFCQHFWNHQYWFVYSLWNFCGSTTTVNQRYMPK